MKKIRIGNDIRLAVNLKQYLSDYALKEREVYNPDENDFYNIDSNPFVNKKYELYYPNNIADPTGDSDGFKPEGTPVSIRSVKAILVNTSRIEDIKNERRRYEAKIRDHYEQLRKHSRFIARFPIEPAMECFHPTPYDVCGCGYPTWRAYPRAYMMAPYHGFGVYPQWSGIYRPLCPPPLPPVKPEFPKKEELQYTAEVAATDHQNIVEVIFPANHQLHTGVYSLVIVAKLYAPGFNSQNLKTVTLDVPNVFELVESTREGVDGDIDIDVKNLRDKLPSGDIQYTVSNDVYVDEGLFSNDDDYIYLERTDGNTVPIDVSGITKIYDAD